MHISSRPVDSCEISDVTCEAQHHFEGPWCKMGRWGFWGTWKVFKITIDYNEGQSQGKATVRTQSVARCILNQVISCLRFLGISRFKPQPPE